MKNQTNESPVVRFVPATRRDCALLIVQCIHGCIETTPTGRPKKNGGPKEHVHGGGALGSDHHEWLGPRSSHCPFPRPIEIVDPLGLVGSTKGVQP